MKGPLIIISDVFKFAGGGPSDGAVTVWRSRSGRSGAPAGPRGDAATRWLRLGVSESESGDLDCHGGRRDMPR